MATWAEKVEAAREYINNLPANQECLEDQVMRMAVAFHKMRGEDTAHYLPGSVARSYLWAALWASNFFWALETWGQEG